jgi:DNA (cytosine-5)-methyltransferase 1
MLNHLDLFSGIGGFSLGLEATKRIKTVAFCEIDSFCTKVLNKNWPTVPVYNDIKELTYEKLKADGIESIDIVTGGYPCQPFSIAGSKKGVKDPRHLWPEYFRLIKELRPDWIIGENVSGHIKLGLDAVQQDLESEGYSLRTFSVSASSIGAPHQRERIWTVANANGSGNQSKKSGSLGKKNEKEISDGKDNSATRISTGTNKIFSQQRETSMEYVEDARRRSWGEQFTRNKESLGRGTFEKTERSTNTDTTSGSSEGATPVADTSSIQSYVGENLQHSSTGDRQGKIRRKSGNVANSDSERGCSGETRAKMQKMLGNHPEVRKPLDGGTLNPNWVEWLMGYQTGHTDLKR